MLAALIARLGAFALPAVAPLAGMVSFAWCWIARPLLNPANWLALGVIVVSTLLNAAYFLPIVFRAFFRDPPAMAAADPHAHESGEAPWPMVLALLVTAAATIILFFWPNVPFALANLLIGR